jgi:hypothetical protein
MLMQQEHPRTIDTAPRDGTRVLAYGEHGTDSDASWATVQWEEYYRGWVVRPNEASEYDPEVSRNITHWLPLPDAPVG